MKPTSHDLTVRTLYLMQQAPQANSFKGTGEDVVYACLNPSEEEVQRGNAIRLPRGSFEISPLLQQTRPGWMPEHVHVSSSLALEWDAPTPTDFWRFSCPTVMKMTDSHHTARPLQKLIDYGRAVGCRYHWTTYNRQHLHFYIEAGLTNAFWMPGSISISEHDVATASDKIYDVVFCGSLDDAGHPYRTRAVRFLQDAGINVHVTRLPYLETLHLYRQAKIVLNCSLNGDLNRRVFETLMAGGFLLTDRLTPESGLPVLFEEGKHLECYGSYDELLEKVRFYLAHPEAARAVARQGQEYFQSQLRPSSLNQALRDYILHDHPLPDFCQAFDDDRVLTARTSASSNEAAAKECVHLDTRIAVYETVQELHRLNSSISLLCRSTPAWQRLSDLQDLPRLRILETSEQNAQSEADVLVINGGRSWPEMRELLSGLESSSGPSVLVVTGEVGGEVQHLFKQHLQRCGFVPTPSLTRAAARCRVFQRRGVAASANNLHLEPMRLPYHDEPAPAWRRFARAVIPAALRQKFKISILRR